MHLEVRFVRDCPHLPVVRDRLQRALEAVNQAGLGVRYRIVADLEDAQRLRFVGSPTVLINQADPFLEPEAAVGMSCQLYRGGDGLSGSPSTDDLITVLTDALNRSKP